MIASSRRRVVLTGATGNMGLPALEELLRAGRDLDLVVPVLPGDPRRRLLAPLRERGPFEERECDLTRAEACAPLVRGADVVVHLAALVSPAADDQPQLAEAVNVGGTRNLLRAIADLGQSEQTCFVGVGSVAATGSRLPPLHWGRMGDPVAPAELDAYAITKVRAERAVMESGLARWVVLRQTGIAYLGLANAAPDPIVFHQPLDNCLEWVSARDSAVLVRRLILDELPDGFWRRAYNVGGGERFRTWAFEFLRRMFEAMGLGDVRDWFEAHWFATRNFHGQWYLDSDELERWAPFRSQGFDDFLTEVRAASPAWRRALVGLLPRPLKKAAMRRLARKPRGTLRWIEDDDVERLTAHYGAPDGWRRALAWSAAAVQPPSDRVVRLSHGYDEARPLRELGPSDLKSAAAFRGGRLNSEGAATGELHAPLSWTCAFGHAFETTAYAVLGAGHWCLACEAPPRRGAEIAARSPFHAQVTHRP